jgi:hypothetical protein
MRLDFLSRCTILWQRQKIVSKAFTTFRLLWYGIWRGKLVTNVSIGPEILSALTQLVDSKSTPSKYIVH